MCISEGLRGDELEALQPPPVSFDKHQRACSSCERCCSSIIASHAQGFTRVKQEASHFCRWSRPSHAKQISEDETGTTRFVFELH